MKRENMYFFKFYPKKYPQHALKRKKHCKTNTFLALVRSESKKFRFLSGARNWFCSVFDFYILWTLLGVEECSEDLQHQEW